MQGPSGPFLFMKSDKFYSTLQKVWSILEQALLTGVKAYLNTTLGQGTLAKLINWFVPKLEDATIRPLVQAAMVEAGYAFDVHQGRVLIEKLKKAQGDGNASDYDRTIDDINH